MKKLLFPVLFFTVLSPLFSETENVRVALLPVVNTSDQDYLDTGASAILDTMEMILRQIPGYDIVVDESLSSRNYSLGEIKKLTEAQYYDNTIYGSLNINDDGEYELSISLFSRTRNDVILSKAQGFSRIMDLFNVSDQIVTEFISEFSGIHIAFGTLTIENSGVDGHYNVYVDNRFIGKDLVDLKLLTGTHNVRISQVVEEELENSSVVIQEDQNKSIGIALKEQKTYEVIVYKDNPDSGIPAHVLKLIRDQFIKYESTPNSEGISRMENTAVLDLDLAEVINKINRTDKKKVSGSDTVVISKMLESGLYILHGSGETVSSLNRRKAIDTLGEYPIGEISRLHKSGTPSLQILNLDADWGREGNEQHNYYEILKLTSPSLLRFKSDKYYFKGRVDIYKIE